MQSASPWHPRWKGHTRRHWRGLGWAPPMASMAWCALQVDMLSVPDMLHVCESFITLSSSRSAAVRATAASHSCLGLAVSHCKHRNTVPHTDLSKPAAGHRPGRPERCNGPRRRRLADVPLCGPWHDVPGPQAEHRAHHVDRQRPQRHRQLARAGGLAVIHHPTFARAPRGAEWYPMGPRSRHVGHHASYNGWCAALIYTKNLRA